MAVVIEPSSVADLAPHSVSLFGRRYPVDLPSTKDLRLRLACIVVTLHVLGQVAFGFRVSVPQIVSAVLAPAVLEVTIAARRTGRLSWPASAMLTGSGIGLILRVNGTARWDHWSWNAWYLYAAVGSVSLLSKYVLRRGSTQVFNPSNLGLLIVFSTLGRGRVQPLDLWWSGPAWATALVYILVVTGGVLITLRLGLFPMAAAFWLALVAGGSVLAASGHCIVTDWSLRPICDGDFLRLVLTSPEILVFLFFMITDPRTAPRSPATRALFGACVALLGVFLMAPERTEFGTKLALFFALACVCALRSVPALIPTTVVSRVGRAALALWRGQQGAVAIGSTIPVLVVAAAVALVLVGRPARTAYDAIDQGPVADPAVVVPEAAAAPLPTLRYDSAVDRFDSTLRGSRAEQLVRSLVIDLAVEETALRRRDPSLFDLVDHGTRLREMQQTLAPDAPQPGRGIPSYHVSDVRLTVVKLGGQSGALIAAEATGTVEFEPADASSTARHRVEPFSEQLIMRPAGEGHWLIVDERAASNSPG